MDFLVLVDDFRCCQLLQGRIQYLRTILLFLSKWILSSVLQVCSLSSTSGAGSLLFGRCMMMSLFPNTLLGQLPGISI